MFIIAYGCPSDSHATYLHYVFGSEDTDQTFDHYGTRYSHGFLYIIVWVTQWMDAIPTFWLESLVQKLTLRMPSGSNHYPTSWTLTLLSELIIVSSIHVCKAKYSGKAIVFRLTFLLSDYILFFALAMASHDLRGYGTNCFWT